MGKLDELKGALGKLDELKNALDELLSWSLSWVVGCVVGRMGKLDEG